MKAVEVSLQGKDIGGTYAAYRHISICIAYADAVVELQIISVSDAVSLNMVWYIGYIARKKQGAQNTAFWDARLDGDPLGVLTIEHLYSLHPVAKVGAEPVMSDTRYAEGVMKLMRE